MDELTRIIHMRKMDHININLKEDVQSGVVAGFDNFAFDHNPFPELDFKEINTTCLFLGKSLKIPILISSMTGGTEEALKININLATAAEARGIALALGSGRSGLESGEAARTYQLRQWAPSIPIYANLGAVQLNYGCGLDECRRVVEMAGADALILHFNTLQEALQPEGQTDFSGLSKKIEFICTKLGVPVIAKEVGWGINAAAARRLVNLGVSCIDVAGAGGTSWSEVEKYRNSSEELIRISSHFREWGIPTAEAVLDVCSALPKIPVIASGGLRKGIDFAKSLALGASLGGMAGGFLKAAAHSAEAVEKVIDELSLEMRIAMFATGIKDIEALKKAPLKRRSLG